MKYILSIDQSTAGTKALLVDERGAVVRKEGMPHGQHFPAPGRVEHDAEQIWRNVETLIGKMDTGEVDALAIANQRETTVIWDRKTGAPCCPAVVWQDVRGEAVCQRLAPHAGAILQKTGLELSPYYPAAKLACVLEENPELRRRAEAGDLCAGTVDSYLIFRLTGKEVFATDVSNAARTQLMNLHTLGWDDALTGLFGIPKSMLPEAILHSDATFGEHRGIPIAAALGDSHASLFGHGCHKPGMVKTSYGTGSSIMQNVGDAPVFSQNGLSASVGFGFQGRVCYVLEGNVTCSADTLIWLRDELELVGDIDAIEPIARTVDSAGGVVLVPAFSGLGAPYFDSRARAILCGMNRGTGKAHVLRAALESIAQQNADVLDAMERDTGAPVTQLHADGGGSVNALLMQMQADLAPCRVLTAAEKDLTALGAAYMAGIGTGLYPSFEEIPGRTLPGAAYRPIMNEFDRKDMRARWADAVRRAR